MYKREEQEKTYTLNDIVKEISVEQVDDKTKGNIPDESGLSQALQIIFENMGLPDAKKSLLIGRQFKLSEDEKELIKLLYYNRGMLKKAGKKRLENPDYKFLFDITDRVKRMLLRHGYDADRLYENIERYLTVCLTNEMSAADTVSDKLKELIEISIADETRYLKTYDKFIWMRAMEGDFLDMIEKWREIFGTFEYMVHQECDRRINEIYREPYADGEKTIEQIMGERVQYYLETCYKEELENLQNEETELKERWKPGHDFIMQRYHHSSSDFLEKNFANMEKVAKIEVRLREIGERRDKIECMCQEIAYDELFGADEKNPVPNMEKPEILLKKAISEVEENYKA